MIRICSYIGEFDQIVYLMWVNIDFLMFINEIIYNIIHK